MRESPRTRRLRTDLKAMEALKADSTILDFSVPGPLFGGPPEVYLVRFHGFGFERIPGESTHVLARELHELTIQLGASYPRTTPELHWKTPIFHPNISASGAVCLGGYGKHWVPSLNLAELCEMLWDMIRYENFDIASPYNREAALWARNQKQFRIPIDPRPIRDRVARRAGATFDLSTLGPIAADSFDSPFAASPFAGSSSAESARSDRGVPPVAAPRDRRERVAPGDAPFQLPSWLSSRPEPSVGPEPNRTTRDESTDATTTARTSWPDAMSLTAERERGEVPQAASAPPPLPAVPENPLIDECLPLTDASSAPEVDDDGIFIIEEQVAAEQSEFDIEVIDAEIVEAEMAETSGAAADNAARQPDILFLS